MFFELTKGVALLLALSQLYGYSRSALRAYPRMQTLVAGLLFGGISIVGMAMPLTLAPGLIFDARSVVVSMASLFGGPWVGLLAAGIAGLYRWSLGGAGAPVGVLVVACSAAIGLLYHYAHVRGRVRIQWPQLLLFGLVVHTVQLYLFTWLPASVAPIVLEKVGPPFLIVLSLATVLLGLVIKDARNRFESEMALRKQKARMEATVGAIPDLLYLLDGNGRFLEAVTESAKQRGKGESALLGKRLHDVLPDAEADGVLAYLRAAMQRGSTEIFELTLQSRHGPRRFEGRANPLLQGDDGVPKVMLLARDITSSSQAQQALRSSELRFRSLLQNVGSVAVQGYRPDGTITYWNAASERLYGYTSDQAVGCNVLELIVPSQLQPEFRQQMSELAQGRTAGDGQELTLRHQDGHEVHVFSSHSAVQGDGAQVTEAELFRFDIDLAERRAAEAELRVAATAFDTQEGMFVTNAQREILRVNQAFCRISGYAESEVVGRTPSLFNSGHHDDAFYAAMNAALAKDGHWSGEIWNRRKNGDIYPQLLNVSSVKDGQGTVTHYVASQTDITQHKAAEDRIRQLAFYDPLTSLPNRRLLLDRLQHALASSARSGAYGALLFIDLDHFKNLNDTLGHDMGDLLLQQVSSRLLETVREEDTVARLGGDEYVVMLEGLDMVRQLAATRAIQVGEKIIATLNDPYRLAGVEYHSTPSIGLTLFLGHEVGVEELLKQADLAMYEAKGAGRNILRFFDPLMQAAVTRRAALENDLRQGLLRGEFQLYYQPQVAASGVVLGVEALIRWNHPDRGMVSPGEFIPVAEDCGQIVAIGNWVLEAACQQLVAWARQPSTAALTIAVNVSSLQFRQPDFAEYVLGLLDYTGANPRCLKLELTESLLVANVNDVIAKMAALRVRGVGFSLDDFGTGYSSLTYLKRLPLDQLKIDQSFVRDVLTDPNDAVIASTIVALGRSLGLAVIAEGVETRAQQQFLFDKGCTTYQGYLFARPMPIAEFDGYLNSLPTQSSLL
jgi:diguanylate cyclase (GGDEF)-like protein/PAS domain S-box-containing protein